MWLWGRKVLTSKLLKFVVLTSYPAEFLPVISKKSLTYTIWTGQAGQADL